MVAVKICGINTPQVAQNIEGADYAGLVFYPRSPRFVSVEQGKAVVANLHRSVKRVALFVDSDDAVMDHILSQVPVDMIQMHGDESPQRIADIRCRFALPVIKAIKVRTNSDINRSKGYITSADWILFDAKGGVDDLPGGTGQSFDWRLLSQSSLSLPWFLSGGLTIDNIAQAVTISGAEAVDVSTGVESRRGCKDHGKIRSFIDNAVQL